jgi:ABC-type enterochelin transport system permease subunit
MLWYLGLFVLGIVFDRYIIPLLDILLGYISSYYNVFIAIKQDEIDQLNAPIEHNLIGFQVDSNEVMDYDDENKIESKIGFKN